MLGALAIITCRVGPRRTDTRPRWRAPQEVVYQFLLLLESKEFSSLAYRCPRFSQGSLASWAVMC
jgi:hypothetical protein